LIKEKKSSNASSFQSPKMILHNGILNASKKFRLP